VLELLIALMESAAVFMTVLRLDRSSLAGDEAMTTGIQMAPVVQTILSQQPLVSRENIVKLGRVSRIY
jgi:hypothetical protein